MAIASATDYHFANVANIDISGEVLPEHPDDWHVNRGEDIAFLCEAFCERKTVEYMVLHPAATLADAESKVKRDYRNSSYLFRNHVVDEWYAYRDLMGTLDAMFSNYSSVPCWCGGIPQERDWNAYPGAGLDDRCPEICPASELDGLPSRNDQVRPWTVEHTRKAFAGLIARQHLFIEGILWFDINSITSTTTYSSGNSLTRTGWQAGSFENFENGNWHQTLPNSSPQPIVPQQVSASDGKMLIFWSAYGPYRDSSDTFHKYRLTVTDVDANIFQLMSAVESQVPTSQLRTATIDGSIAGFIAEASNMRTYLVG